jgi:ABC-type transporter Mla MlaB component
MLEGRMTIEEESHTLRLPPSFDVTKVAEAWIALRAVQSSPGTVTIDGSSVERIDTAGAQVLLAFSQYRRGSTHWKTSLAIDAFLERTGLATLLQRSAQER